MGQKLEAQVFRPQGLVAAVQESLTPEGVSYRSSASTGIWGRLRAHYALFDEVDDVLRGGARKKNLGDTGLFHGGKIGFWDNATNEHGDIVHAFFVEQLHELRADGFVRAGKNGQADDVDVFLGRCRSDHLRGLPQTGVD